MLVDSNEKEAVTDPEKKSGYRTLLKIDKPNNMSGLSLFGQFSPRSYIIKEFFGAQVRSVVPPINMTKIPSNSDISSDTVHPIYKTDPHSITLRPTISLNNTQRL